MKKYAVTLLILVATSAFAGGKHYHPVKVASCSAKECTEEQVRAAIPEAKSVLKKAGMLDKMWDDATVESIATKDFKKGKEWVITLIKPGVTEKRYIFMSLDGFTTGSNSSGN